MDPLADLGTTGETVEQYEVVDVSEEKTVVLPDSVEALIAEFRKARDPQAIRPSGPVAVAWGNQLADAYESLALQAEEAQEETKRVIKEDGVVVSRQAKRLGELEAALRDVRAWFQNEPWKGEPDPSSHGGHPYTPNERAIGYGTFRDPRFLPRALAPATPERCPICEGVDQPGLVHNPEAPYCSGAATPERRLENL